MPSDLVGRGAEGAGRRGALVRARDAAGRRAVRRRSPTRAARCISASRTSRPGDDRRGRRDEGAGALLRRQGRDDVLLVDVRRRDRVEPRTGPAPRCRISSRCPIRTTTISPYHDWGPVPVTGKTIVQGAEAPGADHRRHDDARTRRAASATLDLLTPLGRRRRSPATKLRGALGLRSTWFTVGVMSLAPPAPSAPVAYGSSVTLVGVVRGVLGRHARAAPARRRRGSRSARSRPAPTARQLTREADDHDRLPARDDRRRGRARAHQGDAARHR